MYGLLPGGKGFKKISIKDMNLEQKIKLSRDIMIISGIFCAFTAILLLLNVMQLSRYEPLDSVALQSLVDRLASDPDNEALKQDIRNLDLLARKAHFTSEWQIKTGSWLLFSGSVIFALALWFNRKLQSKIEKPVLSDQAVLPARLITQRWVLFSGLIFMLIALAASFFSTDYLSMYQPETVELSKTPGETVQVLTITKSEIEKETPEAEITKEDDVKTIAVDTTETVTEVKKEEKALVGLSPDEIKKQHNSFRGPNGVGISAWTKIPVDWNTKEGKNVLWKTAIPKPGFNSPVIWDNRIFLSGADEAVRIVYCIDRNSGKILWEQEVSGIPDSPSTPPDVTDDTGLAASSLAVDGTAVYAIFATGDLIAFDMEGKRLWARNLGVPDNHYGHSSSLLTWNNKLFVQYDSNKGGRLLSINTSNGNSLWDVRRNNKISWASPILISLDGKYQLITSADPTVAAHDPETGNVLWSVECMTGEVGPSPAFADGLVLAANEYAQLVAIQPGSEPSILWEDNEYLPEASSPVAYKGLLFLATSYGVIACYDIRTGEKYWEHDTSRGFYSSPVIAEGKVYVIDLGGVMYIFKADKEKTLISQPVLGENAYATPAFSDGRIYLRGEKNLYCIGVK